MFPKFNSGPQKILVNYLYAKWQLEDTSYYELLKFYKSVSFKSHYYSLLFLRKRRLKMKEKLWNLVDVVFISDDEIVVGNDVRGC